MNDLSGVAIITIFVGLLTAFIVQSCTIVNLQENIDSDYIPKIEGHCYPMRIDIPCDSIFIGSLNCSQNLTRQQAIQLCQKYEVD